MEKIARYFEDVEVGEELPILEKQINIARMMAYGAATWDFIRVHYDADYVRESGFKGPFVDGQMLGGFLAQHVQDWAGPESFLRKLGFRKDSKASSHKSGLASWSQVWTLQKILSLVKTTPSSLTDMAAWEAVWPGMWVIWKVWSPTWRVIPFFECNNGGVGGVAFH